MGNVDGVNDSQRPSGTEQVSGDLEPKKDVVQYETYKNVLSQHKKSKSENEELRAKLESYEQKELEIEEKRLVEQGEFKKLLEIERKKRSEEEGKRQQYERDIIDAHKLNAVVEKLPGKIKRSEYYSFIDLEKVMLDPDTKTPVKESVDEVVSRFLADHGGLLDRGLSKDMPHNAPAGTPTTLSYEEWMRLPLKEKRKRMKDVK